MNTQDLSALLRQRYQDEKGWALLENVKDATGHDGQRYADAMAFGLYPSRGMEIIGFELKISRSDWLRELKAPDKAEAVCRYCDKWYVVVGEKEIVKEGELPPTWGLMAPSGSGLRVSREALTPLSPIPIDRGLLASIVRSVCKGYVLASKVTEEIENRTKSHIEARTWQLNCNYKDEKDEKEKLIAQINEFAQKTGIDIRTDSFDSSLYAIGEAVKAIALAKKGSGVLCWKIQEATVAMNRLGEAMAVLEPFLREIKDNPIIGP